MTENTTMGFCRLHALGLIDAAQKDAAQAHPLSVLIKRNASLASYLVWMVEKRLLSHQAICDMDYGPGPELCEAQRDEGIAARAGALTELKRRAVALNAKLLDELLANGLISHADRSATVDFGAPYVLPSTAHALALLVESGIVSAERFDGMHQRVRFERHVRHAEVRAQTIEQTGALLALRAAQRARAPSTLGRKAPLRWGSGVLACALVAVAVYQFAPTVSAMIVVR